MANATVTNQVATLKELYRDNDFMRDLIYKNNPLLTLIPKDESTSGLAGKYIPVPTVYGAPQGRSAAFATAQTNQTASSEVSFFVYRVKNYALVSIDNELLEATASDIGAFVRAGKLQTDTILRNFANDISLALYGDASGVRGTFATGGISSGVITLDNPSDVVNFETQMVLVSYSVSGTTPTQSTSAALGYVIAVNRSAGTVTVSATAGGSAGTPTNWSTSFPNLAMQGDVNFVSGGLAISSTGALRLCGLQAWLPTTAPSNGESFWGVDRSVDTRLSGVRYDGSAQPIEEALIDAAALVAREGGMPDTCFMSFASFAALEKAMGAKVQYVQAMHEDAQIAFKGITVNAPYGPITVLPDRSCPAKKAFLLQMDTWKLRTLGKAPHLLTYGEYDGRDGIRVYNADAVELRFGMYGNLTCAAPGWNATVKLAQ